jgi:hypothetical protein
LPAWLRRQIGRVETPRQVLGQAACLVLAEPAIMSGFGATSPAGPASASWRATSQRPRAAGALSISAAKPRCAASGRHLERIAWSSQAGKSLLQVDKLRLWNPPSLAPLDGKK